MHWHASARLRDLIEATAMMLLAVALVELLRVGTVFIGKAFDPSNLSLLFLIAVMGASLRGGMVAGLWCMLLGAVASIMLYASPVMENSTVEKAADLINLGLFIVVGIVASLLGNAARAHLRRVHERQDVRVKEAREQLRAAMLSSVSHDLKTPLAAIIGALDIHCKLGTALAAERRDDLIATALTEARRLDGLITNILEMAKLETGAVRYRLDWYEPRSIAEGAMRSCAERLAGRRFVLEPATEAWEVEVDAAMLERALAHLLDNALKYTPADVPITLILRYDTDARAFAILVCDEGPGIPVEQHEAIFDKYTRLDRADRTIAGTGLGLPIARLIVEGLGGRLVLECPEKGGSCFTLYLPRARRATLRET